MVVPFLAGRRAGAGSRKAFSLVELLVVVALLSTLFALMLPVLQSVRSTARKVQCTHNLRQLGIAAACYTAAQGHLPPPKVGTQFENRGSTLVLLLPFLEEGARFDRYKLDLPIDAPENLPVTREPVPVYLCPDMTLPRAVPDRTCGEQLAPGSYVISTRTQYSRYRHLDGAFTQPAPDGRYRLELKHITDGTSQTLLIGEVNYSHRDFLWLDCAARRGTPRGGDTTWAQGYWFHAWGHMASELPELFDNEQKFASPHSLRVFRSDHRGGVNFVLLDGSVRFLATDSDPTVRDALTTRSGNETLGGGL